MVKKIKRIFNKFKRIDWIIAHVINIILKKPDDKWVFYHFDKKINKKTWENHDNVINWAENCVKNYKKYENPKLYKKSRDPIIIQGYNLIEALLKKNRNKYCETSNSNNLRILIHVPSLLVSPAGYTWFSNLVQGFKFIGIKAEKFQWDSDIKNYLNSFKPTIFLSIDHENFLGKIDWGSVREYKKKNKLIIGLAASVDFNDYISLKHRIEWAKKNNVSFYYCSFSPKYLEEKKEFEYYFDAGFNILSLEFGANPLLYFPIPNINNNLNYVFIGSKTFEKWPRFYLIEKILKEFPGYISGTGWSISGPKFVFNQERNRYIFARAKVGINLHIEEQINYPSELNERTYNLAICGVPQVIDNPKLLLHKFNKNCFFIGRTADEFIFLFNYILKNPEESKRRALLAQKEVILKHTIFHRCEEFLNKLGSVN